MALPSRRTKSPFQESSEGVASTVIAMVMMTINNCKDNHNYFKDDNENLLKTDCKDNHNYFKNDNEYENLSPRTAMENPSPAIEPAV